VPTAHLNGIDVYYERRGAGPRLLFLNGSGSDLVVAAPWVDAYAAHFDVAAHDQRGLGLTSIPPGRYTMADYAADAMALVDHLGWARCRVVGVSFGGMVAQELAVTWPERVERLALLCTSPGGAGGASYPLHELEAGSQEQRGTEMLLLCDTRWSPEWLASHPEDRLIVEGLGGRRRRERTAEQQRGEREQLLARSHHNVTGRLQRVTAPTLVASGRYDGIAPLANGESIARGIPGAELHVYDGGHLFTAQDPKAQPEIVAFLLGND
jgi:pimeloyl-ACP methyl ester carboxylesterase